MTGRGGLVARLVPFLALRRYAPGERVPSERELAERFKVSRGKVREALSFLEALRIVERRAKSGIYMTAQDTSLEALALFARLEIPLTTTEARQAAELRCIYEVAAIRLACERRTEQNMARLRAILDGEAGHFDAGESIAEDDRLFHGEIVRATQNGVLSRVTEVFYGATVPQCRWYFLDPRRGREGHAQHIDMLAAIERRDAAVAGTLMAAHLHGMGGDWQDQAECDAARLDMAG